MGSRLIRFAKVRKPKLQPRAPFRGTSVVVEPFYDDYRRPGYKIVTTVIDADGELWRQPASGWGWGKVL